jgi:hypothetical protein
MSEKCDEKTSSLIIFTLELPLYKTSCVRKDIYHDDVVILKENWTGNTSNMTIYHPPDVESKEKEDDLVRSFQIFFYFNEKQ